MKEEFKKQIAGYAVGSAYAAKIIAPLLSREVLEAMGATAARCSSDMAAAICAMFEGVPAPCAPLYTAYILAKRQQQAVNLACATKSFRLRPEVAQKLRELRELIREPPAPTQDHVTLDATDIEM